MQTYAKMLYKEYDTEMTGSEFTLIGKLVSTLIV